jgi:hypothetical protein
MKHLKSYKLFESNKESKETVQEISDIFVGVKDCGLEVSDVYTGHALPLGDKEIVTDHNEFSKIGPDGRYLGSFKSFSIRLKPLERGFFAIDGDFFEEVESSIKHVESQFNLELSSIYLRTFDGVWFNSISRMRRYIDELPFAKKQSLRHVTYLDLTFRDLEEFNESVQKFTLESIFDYVKDILRDLEEEHDIEVDYTIGQYHKLYSAKSWKDTKDSELKDSINIDLKDNKYNFFVFNDHILPTIKRLQSFLSEYDLNIDIELVQENEFYLVDEFIEEYGSEEFHELGIIIY